MVTTQANKIKMEKVSLLFLFALCSRCNDSLKVLSISYCQGLCIITLPTPHFCPFPEGSLDILKCYMLTVGNCEIFLIGSFLKIHYSVSNTVYFLSLETRKSYTMLPFLVVSFNCRATLSIICYL